MPFTYVKAKKASKGHILNALARGKAYISSGSKVEYTATSQKGIVLGEMGDNITLDSEEIRLNLIIKECMCDSEVNLYHDGKQIYTQNINNTDKTEIKYNVNVDGHGYYYWEIKDRSTGEVLLLSNPIFVLEGDL